MTMSKREFIKGAAAATATVLVASLGNKAKAAAPGPVIAVISHPVKDYAAWRAVYDSAEPIRQKAGVTGAEVLNDPKDPTIMVVIHRFPTLEAAEAFLGDPGLREAMEKGGVTAAPTVVLGVAV
jgi:quinol monooxygenase YgiN